MNHIIKNRFFSFAVMTCLFGVISPINRYVYEYNLLFFRQILLLVISVIWPFVFKRFVYDSVKRFEHVIVLVIIFFSQLLIDLVYLFYISADQITLYLFAMEIVSTSFLSISISFLVMKRKKDIKD